MTTDTRKPAPQGADRRAFGRRPTNMHAVALIPGRTPAHCTVRDVSEGGALLDFGNPVSLPGRIKLWWEAYDIEARCEVRRIEGARVGVLFLCNAGSRIAALEIEKREVIAAPAIPFVAPAQPPLPMVPSAYFPAPSSHGQSLVQRFRANARAR